MGIEKGGIDISKAVTGGDQLASSLREASSELSKATQALENIQKQSKKKIKIDADASAVKNADAILQRFKMSIDDLKKEEAFPFLKKLNDMQDDKSKKGISVKSAQGVFTSTEDAQKQMIDAWNSLIDSRPGGVSQLSDLVASDDKKATAVLRWANAFEALGGDIASVSPLIDDFVQKMRSLEVFSSDKGYTYTVENLKLIFEQFKELQKFGATFKNFQDMVAQMPKIQPLKIFGSDNSEEWEEETERMEKSTERQKKALLSLEEIKQRLAAKRREKNNFYSDNDLNSIFGFDDDFEDSDNLIQTYSKVLKRLQDERDKELDDIEYWQNAHARAYNEGDDSRASQYFGYMEESIKQYYQYADAIEYVQDRLQEATLNFKPGESWGANEIQVTITLLQKLAEQLDIISTKFTKIDSIESFQSLIKELDKLLTIIPSIKFDEFIGSESASKLGEFVSNLTELSRILDTIDDKDVFHHLNDILQAPGENFSNNLQKIKNGFNDLKTVMNGFNDNGSAVFKSLSDIATAGDAVIEKMQKLFEQSGVKLPLTEQEIVGTPVNVNGSNSASRKRVNIKIQENNGAQKRLEDNLQAIRDLGKANTMKNLVEAKGAAGKASVDELVDSLQKVREAAEKAEIAIGDLYQMKKEGLISQEDLDRYLELYESDEIVNGTLQSQSKAQLAIETQREKQVRESDKAIKQLSDSYIELAQAEEKAANASTEVDRELGRRQVDAIKLKQKELREQVGKLIGSERLKTVETFAQADADEYKRLLSEKRSGKISTSINDLGFSDADNVEKTWDTLISKASRYQAILYKEKSGKTLTATEAEFLQKLKPLYDEAGNHAEQAGEKYNQLNDALKKSQDNIKESILGKYEQSIGGLTDNDIKKPDAYNEQVKKLKTNLEELKKVQFGSDDWFNRINLLDEGLKKLNSDASMKSVKQSSIETLDRKMAEWINSNSAAGEFRVQVEQLRDSLSNVRSEEEFNGIVSDFERVKAAAADAGKTGQSFGEGLIKRFKSLGQYLLSFASFYRIIGTIKQAVSIVTELNDALTEMRKVSSESLSTLEKFQFKTFDLADQVGTNAVAVQKSTAAWLRLGKDFNEAQQAAVDSTKLLNTTEIENIDDATSSLLSITQAYREITREDAIDKINNIGDHFSSSSADLAQGLKNVSAVLKTQGNDIDQALALLTAGNDITQDISKASMGVRTIALRISGKGLPERMVTYGHANAC